MENLLNAHAVEMRKLLKPAAPGAKVSVDALKLLESHAKAARLLQAAEEAYRPYVDASGPPAPTKTPRSQAAMLKAEVRVHWCQARDAAAAGLKTATARSEKLLKKTVGPKPAAKH